MSTLGREVVSYAYVIAPMSGAGHIIPSLQRLEEIRHKTNLSAGHSYILVDKRMKGELGVDKEGNVRTDDTRKLLSWLALLKDRSDVNLKAYGDHNLPETVARLELWAKQNIDIPDLTEKIRKEHMEYLRRELRDYIRFTDEHIGHRAGENQDGDALIVAGYVGGNYQRLEDRLFPEPPVVNSKKGVFFSRGSGQSSDFETQFPQEFRTTTFLVATGKYGPHPRFITFRKEDSYKEKFLLPVFSSTTKTSPVPLERADTVLISNPELFKYDFLGAIVLAAAVTPESVPIHVYGDTDQKFELIVADFLKKYKNQEGFYAINKKLYSIVWEKETATYKPNLNAALQLASSPAIIAEGVGTLRTASEQNLHCLIQPSAFFSVPGKNISPGLIEAFESVECHDAAKAHIAYRVAFREFTSAAATSVDIHDIERMVKIYLEAEPMIIKAENLYNEESFLTDKPIGLALFTEMQKIMQSPAPESSPPLKP